MNQPQEAKKKEIENNSKDKEKEDPILGLDPSNKDN
jgi:hypothetical protein